MESFEAAVKAVSENKGANLSNEEQLTLYAYYKQATVGDVNIDKPEGDEVKGWRFDSWTKVKGTSKEDAMAKYIELAKGKGLV